MHQSNELSLKREMHHVCRKNLHVHLHYELCKCFKELSYFLTKSRLSILKELYVDQAEEQRMIKLDISFAEHKDCKYCVKRKRPQNHI